MTTPEIEEFAKVLVHWVRDAAIKNCDRTLRADAKSPRGKRWKDAVNAGPADALAHMLIPDIVDLTVFQILDAIEQGVMKLSFTASNGKTVDLAVDGRGEMGGWYAGGGGWCEKYSEERLLDDYGDLDNT